MSVVVDDELWSAMGDPIRRRMLDLLLTDGRGTATTLSERLPVTRQAVTKHLGVLDRAGLVHGTPTGRERVYAVDEAQFARAVAQLASVGAAWDARLRRIKTIAEAIQRTRDSRPGPESSTPERSGPEQARPEQARPEDSKPEDSKPEQPDT